MLVLSRKAGESIHIGRQIKVTIVTINGNRVKVGIDAPEEVPIVRSELQDTQERSEDCLAEIGCDARMNRSLCSF
jgi:carbon storage regulator